MTRQRLQFAGEILTSQPMKAGGCRYTCSSQLVGTAGRGKAVRVFCSKLDKKCKPFKYGEKAKGEMSLPELIKAAGGIAPYKGGYLAEEYRKIPVGLRGKQGLTPDDMALALGMRSEDELFEAIAEYSRPKSERELREEEEEYYRGR